MTEDQKLHFYNGVAAGMELFAWWKDGVQYVGTTGTTLKEAQEKLFAGEYDDYILMRIRP